MPYRSARTYVACFLALLVLGTALYMVPNAVGTAAADTPLRIVTTTTILRDIVQTVSGERAVVTSLLSPGADSHTYRTRPSDLVTLARADLIVLHGAGLDAWAHPLIDQVESATHITTVSEALAGHGHESSLDRERVTEGVAEVIQQHTHREDAPAEAQRESGMQGAQGVHEEHESHEIHEVYEVYEEQGGHLHEHGDKDPHSWFDPNLVVHYVESIEDALAAVDPAGTATYRENAAAYIDELIELDHWIRAQVDEIPVDRRKLVTNHDTFRYFAERYHFDVIGVLLPSFSSETEASARHIAQLARSLQNAGVPAVFTEVSSSPRLAETLAREVGGDVRVVPLFTESLSSVDGPASTYLEFMRYNVTSIVEALAER